MGLRKYGNVDIPVNSYTEELAALDDLLEKGSIDKKKYRKERDSILRNRCLMIAKTNDAPRFLSEMQKRSKNKKLSLQDFKEKIIAKEKMKYASEFRAKEEELKNKDKDETVIQDTQ